MCPSRATAAAIAWSSAASKRWSTVVQAAASAFASAGVTVASALWSAGVAATLSPRQRGGSDRRAQPSGRPQVVAGDVPVRQLVVVGVAGGQQPQRVGRAGRRQPADRGADPPELRGGVRRFPGELGVLSQRPQRLPPLVVLPGLADEEPVGLLEGVDEAEVLRRRGVQPGEVERLRLDRRVANPEGAVLQAVGALLPAGGSLDARFEHLRDRRPIGGVHLRLGHFDPHHPRLLGGPQRMQRRTRGAQRHGVERAIGAGAGGGSSGICQVKLALVGSKRAEHPAVVDAWACSEGAARAPSGLAKALGAPRLGLRNGARAGRTGSAGWERPGHARAAGRSGRDRGRPGS